MEILLSRFIPKLEMLNYLLAYPFSEVSGLGFMFVLVLRGKLICTLEVIMDLFLEIKKLRENKVRRRHRKRIMYFLINFFMDGSKELNIFKKLLLKN